MATIETDPDRARAVARAIAEGQHRLEHNSLGQRDDAARLTVRRDLTSPADPLALERIIGVRDLQRINFLARGLRAAQAVCRVRIRTRGGGAEDFGTGFLVAPALLITNHHVLPDPDTARHSLVEFDYEEDTNFVAKTSRVFNLLPSDGFFSRSDIDVTLVAVAGFAHDGTPLADFGHLPLIAESGKGVNGEWVSLIQHPDGQPKQIVLRESRIVRLPDADRARIGEAFIHYTSDTEPGSSGAPVLNDEFIVVALHHKAVAAYDENGVPLNRAGRPWDVSQGHAARQWIANEGVRVSAIVRALQSAARADHGAQSVLARLGQSAPIRPGVRPIRADREPVGEDATPFESSRFEGIEGYDPSFLAGFPIELPVVTARAPGTATQLKDGSGTELRYTHFSVVMNQERRLAFFTAVNIDGEKWDKPTSGTGGNWRMDRRIEFGTQSNNDLYKNNPLDRGHLVRKLDPGWGSQEEIDRAIEDTYHYTNAAPQEHVYNDQIWGNLEDLVLMRAAAGTKRMTVFSGPVFGEFDREYGPERKGGPYLIPEAFWKIAAFVKPDGRLSATAWVLKQTENIDPLFERFGGFNPFSVAEARVFQTTIEKIEGQTGLAFGALKQHDPIAGLEATRVRRLRSPDDMIL